jgi:hypothetical protein
LLEGRAPPRAESASLEGTHARISRAPTHTCSRTRVRAFNALTPQGRATTLTRLGITPRRCSANSGGRPSPPLFNAVRQGRRQLCDTVSPTPVRLTRRALEGGPAAPSNIFYLLIQGHTVTSGQRDRSSPSLSILCGHPRQCSTMPDAVRDIPTLLGRTGTRHRHNGHCATYGPPVNGTLELAHRGAWSTNCYTDTHEAAPVQAQDAPRRLNRSGIRQDRRQLRSTVRHTAIRLEIVQRACKLLPPWPIKGGQPPSRGDTGRRIAITHTLSAYSTILAFASINTSGTWRPRLLSRLSCSHPLRAPRCKQYSAPSTPLLDVRPRPEPG